MSEKLDAKNCPAYKCHRNSKVSSYNTYEKVHGKNHRKVFLGYIANLRWQPPGCYQPRSRHCTLPFWYISLPRRALQRDVWNKSELLVSNKNDEKQTLIPFLCLYFKIKKLSLFFLVFSEKLRILHNGKTVNFHVKPAANSSKRPPIYVCVYTIYVCVYTIHVCHTSHTKNNIQYVGYA